MSSKINISKIIKDHRNTLVDQNTKKPGGDDILYFFIIPVLFSLILICLLDFYLNLELKNALVSGLAIFVGLLFNALVILINIAKNGETKNVKHKVIQQIIANISFSIIIAFISVALVLTRYWKIPALFETNKLPSTGQFLDFIILNLLVVFFLTFLMIMKRTYLIINTVR